MTNVICLLTQVHVRVQLCSSINCSELFRYGILPTCYPSWAGFAALGFSLCAWTYPPRSKIVWELGSCVSGKGCWAFPPRKSICHRISSDMYKNFIKNIPIMSKERASTFNVGSGISITLRGICPITSGCTSSCPGKLQPHHPFWSHLTPCSAHTSTNLRHCAPILWLGFHEGWNPILTMQQSQNYFSTWKITASTKLCRF